MVTFNFSTIVFKANIHEVYFQNVMNAGMKVYGHASVYQSVYVLAFVTLFYKVC